MSRSGPSVAGGPAYTLSVGRDAMPRRGGWIEVRVYLGF